MEDYQYIYTRYYSHVYGFLLKLTCYDRDLAEDLTQETFLQALVSFKRFEGNASVKTWLIAIAKNVAFSHFRKSRKLPSSPEEEMDRHGESPSFVSSLERREQVRNILTIISTFPPKTADVMILRLMAQLPFDQIGQQLKISPGSARVLFARGKAQLVSQMKELYDYEI